MPRPVASGPTVACRTSPPKDLQLPRRLDRSEPPPPAQRRRPRPSPCREGVDDGTLCPVIGLREIGGDVAVAVIPWDADHATFVTCPIIPLGTVLAPLGRAPPPVVTSGPGCDPSSTRSCARRRGVPTIRDHSPWPGLLKYGHTCPSHSRSPSGLILSAQRRPGHPCEIHASPAGCRLALRRPHQWQQASPA